MRNKLRSWLIISDLKIQANLDIIEIPEKMEYSMN